MSGKHKSTKNQRLVAAEDHFIWPRSIGTKSKIAKEMRGSASVKIKAKGPPGMIEKIAKKAVKAVKAVKKGKK